MTRFEWAQLGCFIAVAVVGELIGGSTDVLTGVIGALGALCVGAGAQWDRRQSLDVAATGEPRWVPRLVVGATAGLLSADLYVVIDRLWLGGGHALVGAVIVGVVLGAGIGALGPDRPVRRA
ncbi:hypothetical protein [Actinomyces radicidentis]|uniref:hypothetical protein n=1 Tax=Actinomyces radicidentis TaxID=111015 RepID=UPI0026E00EB4|nr:hypothetical protein [Actinomyces radicidentis]